MTQVQSEIHSMYFWYEIHTQIMWFGIVAWFSYLYRIVLIWFSHLLSHLCHMVLVFLRKPVKVGLWRPVAFYKVNTLQCTDTLAASQRPQTTPRLLALQVLTVAFKRLKACRVSQRVQQDGMPWHLASPRDPVSKTWIYMDFEKSLVFDVHFEKMWYIVPIIWKNTSSRVR